KQFVIDGPALKDDTEAKEKCPFICEAGGSAPIGGKNCQWTGQWSPTTLDGKAGSICQCTTASEEVAPATTKWSPTTLDGKAGSICQCTTASEEVAPATTK
ncbi:MAG: hypothetical protein BWK78_08060, partial [Thiotrichaceae bacterium IS1]